MRTDDVTLAYIVNLAASLDDDLLIDPDGGDFSWREDTEFENFGRVQELINVILDKPTIDID